MFLHDQESLWLYPASGGVFVLSPGGNMELAAPLASSTFARLTSLHTPQVSLLTVSAVEMLTGLTQSVTESSA